MATTEASSVDSICTDPPYGLGFMGKEWDSPAIARAAERDAATRKTLGPESASRPGRAQARSASAFGSPAHYAGPVRAGIEWQEWCGTWALEALRVLKPGGCLVAFGAPRTYHRLTCAIEDAGFEIRDCLMWLFGSGFPKSHNGPWGGTALKPAWEPIVLARKPLVGTVAANVLEHGTGGLNVDGCRVETDSRPAREQVFDGRKTNVYSGGRGAGMARGSTALGRWPANVVLDESAAEQLDAQTGALTSGYLDWGKHRRNASKGWNEGWSKDSEAERGGVFGGDSGGASRFFYTAKADPGERHYAGTNKHPTVKPVSLMRWLCRLVTPKGGLVLDPFMGSGSTGIAALAEGFRFLGIEREAEYVELARRRIAGPLFADADYRVADPPPVTREG